jgi:hypothetical protein
MGKGGAKMHGATESPQPTQTIETIVIVFAGRADRSRLIDVSCHSGSVKKRQGSLSVCYLTFNFFA